MSDAYAVPGPWAARTPREGRRGPHPHHHDHPRRGDRAERRAAFLAAVSGMAAEADDHTADPTGPSAERGGPEGRGRGRRFCGPGFGGPGFGGPPFGGGRGRGRGRARRGDVRAAILSLLAEEPRNGYGVIQEIEERSNGVWRPSPGAVYPALQQLEDEALVRPVELDGRKVFELTDAGRAYVADNPSAGAAPWEAVAAQSGTSIRDAKHQLAQLWHAYAAVHQDGTPAQVEAASAVLTDARRSLYRILAEDAVDPTGTTSTPGPEPTQAPEPTA